MISLKQTETKLSEIFNGFPSLPESSKESLAVAWPWIALVFGVLQLLAAWGLWRLATVVEKLNQLATFYTARSPLSSTDKGIMFVGVLVLAVDGVILLKAYSQLKMRNKKGWDLLFLGALINVGYAFIQLFIRDHGFGSFVFSLLSSSVGFYLLFQVKDKFAKNPEKIKK